MGKYEIEEMAKAERLAYFKAWRTANKEKVKKHNQTYWKKRALKKMEEERENDRS